VDPTATGEQLSVVVGAQEKTLVTVRILNHEGQEIRDLYTGFIQPGHWSFRWDGDLSDGVVAPAGNYEIDVQTGALHQTKDIRIKAN
jgi:flagellar hook assembly protein FlgD